ncbi:MAG: transposase, partial [Actinobacteria bacterium]|nr:transposase [Actinomycetota bacterium]
QRPVVRSQQAVQQVYLVGDGLGRPNAPLVGRDTRLYQPRFRRGKRSVAIGWWRVHKYCRVKSRLRPMRGLKRLRSAHVISTGYAFVQNLRRGHYELATDIDPRHRLPAAFTELALAI